MHNTYPEVSRNNKQNVTFITHYNSHGYHQPHKFNSYQCV